MTIEHYKTFFVDQVKDAIAEQKKIDETPISQLLRSQEVTIAYATAVLTDTGYVVFKFPRTAPPRLHVQRCVVLLRKDAFSHLGNKPSLWQCSWKDFCDNSRYHSSQSEILPMRYVPGKDDGYVRVACGRINSKLYNIIESATKKGRELNAMIYDPFPPVEYYRNLCHYMDLCHSNKELLYQPTISYDQWQPTLLAYHEEQPTSITNTVLDTLHTDNCCILQGPPGTGKSYTIATIIAHYLRQGSTVCATTMANKGLIELIKQPPLREFIAHSKVHKTHCSADELRQVPGLDDVQGSITVMPGELLCATYYVLSQAYSPTRDVPPPRYDLLVIDEASQAFLTTIVAFKQLAVRCLIVGDPMQLPPIVKMNNPLYNAWNIHHQVNGLTTFALAATVTAYRIVTTFRLTPAAAQITGIFYNNNLRSVRQTLHNFARAHHPLLTNDHGAIVINTNDIANGKLSTTAMDIIHDVINTIATHFPRLQVAVIAPFKDTIKALQQQLATAQQCLDLTIETVDRIQGITVDYAILYLPARHPAFAVDEKRFNVATSRSASTTLIITDIDLLPLQSLTTRVRHFLIHATHMNPQYNVISNPADIR